MSSDNRPWVDKEKLGLDSLSDREGVDVIRDQVAARIDGHRNQGANADQIRFFDGLFKNADGTYSGVEVKSGNAGRTSAQRVFDNLVSPDKPAIATLPDGTRIEIVSVILEEVE